MRIHHTAPRLCCDGGSANRRYHTSFHDRAAPCRAAALCTVSMMCKVQCRWFYRRVELLATWERDHIVPLYAQGALRRINLWVEDEALPRATAHEIYAAAVRTATSPAPLRGPAKEMLLARRGVRTPPMVQSGPRLRASDRRRFQTQSKGHLSLSQIS